MPELKDYSGPFNPNLRMEDFSKETLVNSTVPGSRPRSTGFAGRGGGPVVRLECEVGEFGSQID
jgi:hypothetical protein